MPPGDDGVGCAVHIPPMKFSRKGVAHCLTLWHNIYMSMVRIAVRVPQSLADELRVEGEAHGCDLSWAVRRRLNADIRGSGTEPAGPTQRSGNGASVSVLPQAEGKPKRLHPVQPVRSELAGGGNEPTKLPEHGPASCAKGSCPHGKLNAAYCRATGGIC